MYKFLTIFIVLLSVALVATGCGKKEAPAPEAEITMPMSPNIDGTGTTNLTTKAGGPVEAGSTQVQTSATLEPMQQGSATITNSAAPTVIEIQQALKNANLYTGAVDGKSGPKTKKAIIEFQKKNGLNADGKVGSRTWEKLKTYLNQSQ